MKYLNKKTAAYFLFLFFCILGSNVFQVLAQNEVPVIVVERSGSDLVDYQVLVNINIKNLMFDSGKSDQNIAFYDEKKVSLNYWLEEWDETSGNAKIWVKIPVLKANETKNLIMDLSGNGESNGEATFVFFDDFNQSKLDNKKWQEDVSSNYDETLDLGISYSVLRINTSAGNSDPEGSHALVKSITKFSPNVALRIKERDNTSSWYPGNFGFGQYHPLPSSSVIKGIYSHEKYGFFNFNNSYGSFQPDHSNYHITPDYASTSYPRDKWTPDAEWHTFDIIWQNSSSKLFKDENIMADISLSSTIPSVPLPVAMGDLGQWGAVSSTETNVDWIIVRKFVEPEPNAIISEAYRPESTNAAIEEEKGNNIINEPDDKSIVEVQASSTPTANAEKNDKRPPSFPISNVVFYSFILIVILVCILLIWVAKRSRDNKKANVETKLCLKCGTVTDKSIDKCAKCGSNNFSARS